MISISRSRMNRRDVLKTGAFGVLALSGACRTTSIASSASTPSFPDLRDAYFVRFLELNPVLSTYVGGDGYAPSLRACNTKWRDFSADALAAEVAWLKTVRRDLKTREDGFLELIAKRRACEADPQRSPADCRSDDSIVELLHKPDIRQKYLVDMSVMRAQIDFVVHMLEDLRYQERSVDTYAGEPFHGVDWQLQQMTTRAGHAAGGTPALPLAAVGTEDEWNDVVMRVAAIPAFLDTARTQLLVGVKAKNLPDRRMVAKNGMEAANDSATYFAKDLHELAAKHTEGQPWSSAMRTRLTAAGTIAGEAFTSFAKFLGETYRPDDDKTDRFAIGENEYAWRTRNCFLEKRSPAELFEYGAQEITRHQKLVFEVAREVAVNAKLSSLSWANDNDARASVRAVMAHLEKDAPKNDDELFQWYRDCIDRSVAWGRERKMFDIPNDYRLDLLPTPPVLRGGGGASYYPPPAFKEGAVGRFYLDPTDNDPALLAANHRATVADTTTHEGFPGHDWHAKLINAHAREISNVRWLCPGSVDDSFSMWADSMAAEGWGLYAEELMAEPAPGRPHGFYDAAERLIELQWQLVRAVRVRVDVGMHTGRMSFDEAVDTFAREASFHPTARTAASSDEGARAIFEGATEQVARYAAQPTQAITYNLGKAAILELRAEEEKRGAFDAPRFHERLLKQGMIPAAHLRA